MIEHLSSDSPVSTLSEDRFQRYPFSKRIAQTIINRKSEDCIILGIYGAWGEGKTSVINFILTELQKNDDIIILKFNPWRYKDEEDLLRQFFDKLAGALQKGLKTKKEKAGEFIGKYAKFLKIDLPWIGNIGESAEGLGQVLSEVDVEELKDRLGELLKENKQKIVVFIDDIDRLEKTEIHAIFRLVKLTADFPNTLYVLSFDKEMVSSAIGERFGKGDAVAGRQFLEKIVQVPLVIPKAQQESLRDFTLDLIDQALESNNLELTEDQRIRVRNDFPFTLLPGITTPRHAVGFANSVSFVLPLLQGEVHLLELIYLEGIKTLYPEVYEVIKENPDLFVVSINDFITGGIDKTKTKQISDLLTAACKALPRRQSEHLGRLIGMLFPNVQSANANAKVEREPFRDEDKRLGDPNYFHRYFTYSLQPRDLSDVAYEKWVEKIIESSDEQIVAGMHELVTSSSMDKFLYKLRAQENKFTWEEVKKLTVILAREGQYFPGTGSQLMRDLSSEPRGQMTTFIGGSLRSHISEPELFELAKQILEVAEPIPLLIELHRQMAFGIGEGQNMFNDEDYKALSIIIARRALNAANHEILWKAFPRDATTIVYRWIEAAPEEAISYIQNWIDGDPEKAVELLSVFVKQIDSSAHPGQPYIGNLEEHNYKLLIEMTGPDMIRKHLEEKHTAEELYDEKAIKWNERHGPFQNDLNLARQFIHWDYKNRDLDLTMDIRKTI